MNEKTDIDRLHDVIQGRIYGRGVGKTTARIHELAGYVELGESRDIICLIPKRRDLHYLRPMVDRIFAEHGLQICGRQSDRFTCNGKRVRFCLYSDLFRASVGLRPDFVEMEDNPRLTNYERDYLRALYEIR